MRYFWVLKVLRKRATFLFSYILALYTDKHYKTPDGVVLTYSNAYHHAMAKSAARGEIEPEMMALWKQYARDAKIIYDIGGFNGIYGLTAKKANPNAIVHIFEPDFINVSNIERNIDVNGWNPKQDYIYVNKLAVSDAIEEIPFASKGTTYSRMGGKGETVRTTKLDNLGTSDLPYLLKIDAAGAEGRIIMGGRSFLARYKPPIFLQTDTIYRDHDEMWDTLEKLGYRKIFYEKIPSGERCVLIA